MPFTRTASRSFALHGVVRSFRVAKSRAFVFHHFCLHHVLLRHISLHMERTLYGLRIERDFTWETKEIG